MRPPERRDSGQHDLLRSRLDQIIDLAHPLAQLAHSIEWGFLEQRLGAVYTDLPGRPPLPTRLMAGLAILKHMHNLSDESLCDRWLENPYYQLFCGEEFFRHKLPFDRSSITRWRQRKPPQPHWFFSSSKTFSQSARSRYNWPRVRISLFSDVTRAAYSH